MIKIGGERFGGVGACLADSGRRLRDERRDRRRLHVDSGPDLLQRRRSPVKERVERSRIGRFRFPDARCSRLACGVDLGEPRSETGGCLGDELVGAFSPLGEVADLLSK